MSWLSGYTTRRELTFDHTLVDGDLSDFPVLVKLTTSDFDFSKTTISGFDIRFTSDDGTTLLKYERERHDSTNSLAEYWVKIPTVSSGVDTNFYIYYRTEDTADGADPTNVWDSNYKGVWHLNQDPSGAAPQELDSTVNNNDGTSNGAMTSTDLVEGKVDGALDFDGSDDYIEVPDDTSLDITGVFTITGWFYVQGDGSGDYPDSAVSKWWDGTTRALNFVVSPTQTSFTWRVSGDAEDSSLSASLTLNDGFHFISIIHNGTDAYLYVDAVQKDTLTAGSVDTNDANLRIGAYNHTSSNGYFDGIVDEVRILDIDRSPAYIKASYNSENDSLLTYGSEEAFIYYYFSGYTFEQSNPVSRKLYLHNRTTGNLVATTTSSGNGYYYMETTFSGSHYIVCLDDDAGVEYNDMIIGPAFPTTASG